MSHWYSCKFNSSFHQNSCPSNDCLNCRNSSVSQSNLEYQWNHRTRLTHNTISWGSHSTANITEHKCCLLVQSVCFALADGKHSEGSQGQKDYAFLKCHLSLKLDYNKQIKRQGHCENNLKRFFFLSIKPEWGNTPSRWPFPIIWLLS